MADANRSFFPHLQAGQVSCELEQLQPNDPTANSAYFSSPSFHLTPQREPYGSKIKAAGMLPASMG